MLGFAVVCSTVFDRGQRWATLRLRRQQSAQQFMNDRKKRRTTSKKPVCCSYTLPKRPTQEEKQNARMGESKRLALEVELYFKCMGYLCTCLATLIADQHALTRQGRNQNAAYIRKRCQRKDLHCFTSPSRQQQN